MAILKCISCGREFESGPTIKCPYCGSKAAVVVEGSLRKALNPADKLTRDLMSMSESIRKASQPQTCTQCPTCRVCHA